ncbi:MAG TPA: uroporphyrinogen-III C-methyltransferase [Gammaproteobacteria bacterium]|nr:uroporphyrinogen-III C-methyltransferase [Gammaproteobacteria bacterium]
MSPKAFPVAAFLLFLVLVLGIAGLWVETQRAHHDIMETQKHLIALTSAQKVLETNLNNQINQTTDLNRQIGGLANRLSNDQRTYKVAEIAYLVKMANLRLTTQHDVTSALILLKQANQEINALNDPEMETFREALVKNITDLQAITPVDMEGLSDKLTQLQTDIPTLSILVAPKPNTSILENTPHQAQKKWWDRAWDNIRASLKQLVVITHQSEDIPAMMTPDQQIYLQENLQLLIMQAQWSALNHNNALYQSSLKQAKDWVNKYYVQNSANTQTFLKSLDDLIALNLSPDFPDLTRSLTLINQGTH